MRCLAGLIGAAALAGCAAKTPYPPTAAANGPHIASREAPNVPDYATRQYEPFNRAAAVAIAIREWRLFGQPIDDDPPGTRPPLLPDQKPERFEGLWQRVGDYWYESQDLDSPQADWTGKHDAYGNVFPADEDDAYAWSAAFISYIMRIAGAGTRFPYSQSHATYINIARRVTDGTEQGWVVSAQPIDVYPPMPGDLICTSRTIHPVRYSSLPAAHVFPAHCDIVVAQAQGSLSVVGGNVDDAVTMKHIPVTSDGRLGLSSDEPIDTRYNWFVVLKIAYDVPAVVTAMRAPD